MKNLVFQKIDPSFVSEWTKRTLDNYFGMEYHRQTVMSPLKLTGTENTLNIYVRALLFVLKLNAYRHA